MEHNIPLSSDRAAIATDLYKLLERQENLTAVDFDNCFMNLEEDYCWQVFRTIASTLKSLSIRNFFDVHRTEEVNSGLLEMAVRLKMLVRLALNFRFLYGNVLVELTRASPGLKEIILLADTFDPEEAIPLSSWPDWQEAAQRSPDLRVWMTIMVEVENALYDHLLLPDMPLLQLKMTFNEDITYNDEVLDDNSIEMEITDATGWINHPSLKVFILERQGRRAGHRSWNRPEPLVALVKACPFLTDVSLQMTLTLDTLLQIAAAAHPGTEEEGEEEGKQSTRPPGLKIHITGCDPVLDRRALTRLSSVNPFFTVHVCDGCRQLLDSQPFV